MNWAKKWQNAVLNVSSRKGWELFNDKNFANWYDIQLKHNDYPGVLLEKVKTFLRDSYTLLDIGAGTGAFTIPIAKNIKRVTAIEPSMQMAECLYKKMGKLDNIYLINKRIEGVMVEEVEKHDVVIAINSLYCVEDIKSVLKKIISLAKKQIFIVISSRSNFYKDMWFHFKEEEYKPPPSFIHIYNLLHELNVFADIEMLDLKHTYVYMDMEQALKYWMLRLDLGPEKRKDLGKYLNSKLASNHGKLCYGEEDNCALIKYSIE